MQSSEHAIGLQMSGVDMPTGLRRVFFSLRCYIVVAALLIGAHGFLDSNL